MTIDHMSEYEHDLASRSFAMAASKEKRDEDAARQVIVSCIMAQRLSHRGACAGAAVFIEECGSGIPEVEWFGSGSFRQAALMWASTASQSELSAYVVAAVTELENSPITNRAAKRLAAMGYKSMDAESRAAFNKWINNQ